MNEIDEFGFDPERTTAMAAQYLNLQPDDIIEVDILFDTDVAELRELIEQGEDGYDRLRQITGRKTGYGATKAAQTLIMAIEASEPVPVTLPSPDYPDDRAPSVSIRAWRGGLPGQGQR